MPQPDCDLRVRTLRIATGAFLLSFAGRDFSGPSLRDALDRVPLESVLVLNVDGLGESELLNVIAFLSASPRVRETPRRVIIVCEEACARSLFELSGLNRLVLIKHSVEEALSYVLGRKWLAAALADAFP